MLLTDTHGVGVSAQNFGFISGLVSAIRRQQKIRKTRMELSALSDRELCDIGLKRADIARVARSA